MTYMEPDPAQSRGTGLKSVLGSDLKKGVNASADALGRAGIGYADTPPKPRSPFRDETSRTCTG